MAPKGAVTSDPASPTARTGFSVLELLIVLAIATAITAILMPIFSMVRESAHRVICASNERQIGMAMIMYSDANRDYLPPSSYTKVPGFKQQDMMASHLGGGNPRNWEGIGILFEQHYCNSAECFYCPSHTGDHSFDRYERWYDLPIMNAMIFTNYHYAGDFDRDDLGLSIASGEHPGNNVNRKHLIEADTVLLSDGLRTVRDFNHIVGMNVLRGDGSVRWRDDKNKVYSLLPRNEDEVSVQDLEVLFTNIWSIIIDDE